MDIGSFYDRSERVSTIKPSFDALIDKTLEISGNKNKYQYIILIITFVLYTNISLIEVSFPYLEKQPEVNYIDPDTGENITTQLNYSICKNIQNYTITRTYGHSWTSEFNIECNEVKNDLIGTLLIFGATIGISFIIF